MTMQAQRESGGSMSVDTTLLGLDAATIKSIETANGWQQVNDAEFVHFAVGTAHSPVSPTKVYGALRYRSNGQEVLTPLNQIISFSQSSQLGQQGNQPGQSGR